MYTDTNFMLCLNSAACCDLCCEHWMGSAACKAIASQHCRSLQLIVITSSANAIPTISKALAKSADLGLHPQGILHSKLILMRVLLSTPPAAECCSRVELLVRQGSRYARAPTLFRSAF